MKPRVKWMMLNCWTGPTMRPSSSVNVPSAQRDVSPFGWLMLKIDAPMDTGALLHPEYTDAPGRRPVSSSSVPSTL